MKLVYNAIFENCEEGGYSVSFPDLPGCYTMGDNLEEAIEMAEEAAYGWLIVDIDEGDPIPKPTAREHMPPVDDGFVNTIIIDMDAFDEKFNKKSVKKTLTIPAWINEASIKAGINFSHVLQEGLKKRLGV